MEVTFIDPLQDIAKDSGRGIDEIFRSFLCIAACTLAMGKREELYFSEIKKYNKEQINLFPKAFAGLINDMENNPFTDVLGSVHENFSSTVARQQNGEFYTPNPICRLMAEMSLDLSIEKRPITISEPCTGSGRMILALAEAYKDHKIYPNELWVEAWDLSRTAVYMTFINTTLWSIPCRVVHGNTLSAEIFDVWPNLFFYPLYQEDSGQEEVKKEEENKSILKPFDFKKTEVDINLPPQPSLFDFDE